MEEKWEDIKILIVEDSVTSIMFFEAALKRQGANVILAIDGEQAIELVKKNPDINIVVMDINLPKLSGLQATPIIKEINPKIGIILQTAYILEHTEDVCLKAGCDIYLKKPISLNKLVDSIKELLKR